jgi:3D (Asp-Asp-Asp) domain-containing protein
LRRGLPGCRGSHRPGLTFHAAPLRADDPGAPSPAPTRQERYSLSNMPSIRPGRSPVVVPLGVLFVLLATCSSACFETRGTAWMQEPLAPDDHPPPEVSDPASPAPTAQHARRRTRPAPEPLRADDDRTESEDVRSAGRLLGVFHNTYYSFPDQSDYAKGDDVTIFDAACKPIATVPREFHDKLCVQGSGRLADRRTVSFAKRGCDCAAVCPRSAQKICYEALDPARFPWGRGATGGPITPFRTIAVDSSIVPLGTPVFIPAFVGLAIPGGGLHDGCFVAQDRGLRVVGRSVDVYTGSESATAAWNRLVGTGTGVELYVDDPRCAAFRAP